MSISLGCLRLLPLDTQQSRALPPLVVWVVRVWEPEPPEGVEPLEWMLLTSVAVLTLQQAWERVDWYRARWIVEDDHQGLKPGCRIKQRQLQSYEGLRCLLGLLAPLAVRLLQVRAASREDPARPASQVLPSEVVHVLASLAKVPAADLTAQQAWHTIARCGGSLGCKGDGPPGWKTLWKERLIPHPNLARRHPSGCSTFSRLPVNLIFGANSQLTLTGLNDIACCCK